MSSRISIAQRLFISIFSLFVIFASCVLIYQYFREKEYKIGVLNTKLQDYNEQIYEVIDGDSIVDLESVLTSYIAEHHLPELRFTVLTVDGNVIYDNQVKRYDSIPNHITRPEIRQALRERTGYDVRRVSQIVGIPFFYSASYYPGKFILRSALPYSTTLKNMLEPDKHFLIVICLIIVCIGIVFWKQTERIGKSVVRLREFARKADRNEAIDEEVYYSFPKNELGDISKHIIQLYKHLVETKEELVNEQEILIAQKEEQARIKRQLTQNIAHELKTPVTSIQGYLETIITNADLSEEKRAMFIERSYAQSNRLTRLLKDITILSSLDDASELFDMDQVDVNAIVQTVIDEVSLQLEEKKISLKLHLMESTVIKGNSSLIYSIFRNLIDNAMAYAGKGITITIRCFHEDNRYYYFSFTDTGFGVAPEHLDRLFERFYRVDKGRSRKLGGTGLGLAIVKNGVVLHGGTITAKNVATGGLEFVFTLAKEKPDARTL